MYIPPPPKEKKEEDLTDYREADEFPLLNLIYPCQVYLRGYSQSSCEQT